jgi:hypothetical protein
VNDEDLRLASGNTRNVEEVDVVLGEGHDRIVATDVSAQVNFLGVRPRESAAVGRLEKTHV